MDTTVKYLNETVWATLKPSKLGGVGVFAIRDIKKGAVITDYSIHTINNIGFLKVAEEDMKLIHPSVLRLILDRSMFQEGQKNFYFYSPNMEVCLTSFMNHSDRANSDGRVALRDIDEGEEITEDYTTLFQGKNPHNLVKAHYSWLFK